MTAIVKRLQHFLRRVMILGKFMNNWSAVRFFPWTKFLIRKVAKIP